MKTTLLLLPLILTLTGCMALSVPRTQISGTINGQPFTLSTPKDSEMKNLMIEVRGVDHFGTNYTAISIDSLEANMNPEIITTTADRQIKMIQAIGSEIRSTAATAAK